MKKIKLAIVAAYAKELAPLCHMGRQYLKVSDGVAYLAAGIGPVAAAFGLTHFLEDYRPKVIISIGTAGYFDRDEFEAGQIVRATWAHVDSTDDAVYLPSVNQGLSLKNPPKDWANFLKPYPTVKAFCPQEITRTKTRAQLLKSSYDVETLELYALAFVADKFRIPLISLLGLSNEVGPKAHEQWRKNESACCFRLAETLQKHPSFGKNLKKF